MFFSSSEFVRPPPRPLDGLILAAQVTPCRKKRENASTEEESSSSSSEEGEVFVSEEDEGEDALRLRGGVVRRRKKSPVKRGLDDLAKAWAVDLGPRRTNSQEGKRLARSLESGQGSLHQRFVSLSSFPRFLFLLSTLNID